MDSLETVWVFDVDGVLTHPSQKKVTELRLFDELIKRLEKGESIALNTGRSIDYIEKQIVTPLLERIKDVHILDNFLGVAEKGVIWQTFSRGNKKIQIDSDYSVSLQIQQAVKKVVESTFSDIAFFDETKRTMVSVEMHDGFDVEKFWQRQKELDRALKQILVDCKQDDRYIVDPSRIATDIQAKGTGKDLGAKRILQWLGETNIISKKVVCFGDGISDLAMAEEFMKHGIETEFVFVGEKNLLTNGQIHTFPITYTDSLCEQGTYEYLLHNL